MYVDCLLLIFSLLLCLCLPFLSCLPPLTCVIGSTGSDVSLSWQRLQKGDSHEVQTVVDLTNTLKSSSHNTFYVLE